MRRAALEVDPAKSLYLGNNANERNAETLDLTRCRGAALATHGLIPGDLDGSTSPTQVLTAPEAAEVNGDGLLAIGKILALELDADWVILSACNSGATAARKA